MRNYFTTGEYLSGIDPNEPAETGDTENRSWGTFAKDVAIDALARPVVSAVRTGTQAARMADEESPTLQAIDTGVGGAEAWLKKQRSPRAEALDQLSLAPGPDERSFWNEPIAGSLHSFLPSVPYAIAGILTGGSSWAAQAGMTAAAGAFGGGEALNELRDFADTTPKDQLLQLPPFKKIMDENGGDERKARIQFFRDSIDPTSMTFNFLVNALEVPAFMRGMGRGAKGIGAAGRGVDSTGRRMALGAKDRLLSAAEGGVEGAVLGSAEGGVEALIQQQAAVKRGQQEQIEGGEIEKGIASGAVFAGPMAAFHAIAPPAHKATGPGGTGAGEIDTLSKQLGQPRIFPDEGMPEQVPQPGQGRDVVTPEAPLPPQFPEIERPGLPDPGDFGGEESRIGPAPPFAPGTPYGQTPPPFGPPKPTRAQQLYQRQGVYDQTAEPAETATARQPEQPFAGTRLDRLYRERDNLEAGQFRREELLTDDTDLARFAAQRGMSVDQVREQLTREHESGQQRLGQLNDFIRSGAAHTQERNLGVPERRAALKETGITPTRVRPYGEIEPTGRMETEPPVVTPEAPRAPYFRETGELRPTGTLQGAEQPSVSAPSRPMTRKKGEVDRPAIGTAEAPPRAEQEIEGEYTWGQAEPEERPGVSQEHEDLIRSGVSVFTPAERQSFVGYLSQTLQRNGRISRFELPPELRNEKDLNGKPLARALTKAERGAVGYAAEYHPQQLIEIIRQPPTGTLAEHPVLHELQTRMRTRRQVEERAAEEERAKERRKAETAAPLKVVKEPQRTGKVKTGMERGFEASLRGYKAAPFAQSLEKWQALHKRAVRLDNIRAAAGVPRQYEKQLGDQPAAPEAQRRLAQREREQVATRAREQREKTQQARDAKAEARKRKLTRFYDQELPTRTTLSEQPLEHPRAPEEHFSQLVRDLEDLSPAEFKMPDPMAFRNTEEDRAHIEAVQERLNDVAALLEINAQRVAEKKKQLPIPVGLYDTLVEAGLVYRPTESPYGRKLPGRQSTTAPEPKGKPSMDEIAIKMAHEASTVVQFGKGSWLMTAMRDPNGLFRMNVNDRPDWLNRLIERGATPGEIKRAAISSGMMNWEKSSENQNYTEAKLLSDHLREQAPRGYLRGRRSALIGSKERALSQTVSERLRQRKLGTLRDTSMLPSRQGSEFGVIRRPKAEPIVDKAERTTEKFKAEAARLSKAAIRGMLNMGKRFVNRVKADSEWDLIVTLAEERAAEMRERVARGLPPSREATYYGKPLKNITGDEALARVRKGLPAFYDPPPDLSTPEARVKAGRIALRSMESWLPTVEQAIAAFKIGQQKMYGTSRTRSSRAPMYKDRESVVNMALNNAVTRQFGTEKKFRDLTDKLGVLNKLPRRGLTGRLKMPDASPAMQRWLKEVLNKETKTAFTGYAERPGNMPEHIWEKTKRTERQTRMWLNAKREQVRLSKQLRTFINFATAKANRELLEHKKAKGYKEDSRSIEWQLAKKMVKQITDKEGRPMGTKVTHQSGVEREGNYNYNFANDLQKAGAALDRIISNLEDVDKGSVRTSARVLAKGQSSKRARKFGLITSERNVRAASVAEEYGQYANEFDAVVGNVIDGMDRFLKNDLEGISKERALRNLIQTERRRFESFEAKQETDLGKESLAEGIQDEWRTVEAREDEEAAQAAEIAERDDVTYDPDTGEALRPDIDLELAGRGEAEPAGEATEREKGVDLGSAAGADIISALSNVPKEERGRKIGYGDVITYDPVLNVNTPTPDITGGGRIALLEGRNVIEEELQQLVDKNTKTLERAANDTSLPPKVRALAERKIRENERRMEAIRKNFPHPYRGGPLEMAAPEDRLSNVSVPIQSKLPKMPEREQAVWDQHPKTNIEEILSTDSDGRWDGERAAASYAIHENGQLYNVNDHGGHVHNILAARDDLAALGDDPEVSSESNSLLEENPDSGRPYVHVSRYAHSGLLELGIDRSSSVTRQQAATIKRLVTEARKANRAGAEVRVQMDWQRLASGAEFGDTGLPLKRLPKWKAGQSEMSLTHNQQRHLAAYDRFAQPGENAMDHPLIEPRMTATEVIAQVKHMLAKGLKGHNLPSKYINPEFLDQLAANAGEVGIYNAPIDVVSSLGRRGIAFYQPETDRIALPGDAAAQVWVNSAVHELAHAVEIRMLSSDPRFAEGVHALYTKAVQYAKRQGYSIEKAPRLLYGLKNVHEFLAETQSNEDFRQWLNRVTPPEGYGVISGIKSVMNALYKVIRDGFRRLMGAGHGDTALDVLYYDQSSVLGQTDKMIARMMEDIQRNGRPAFVAPQADAEFGGDGKYYLSMAGTKAFVDHIKGAAFEKGHDVGDAARYAWKTMDKNRGLGLVMHTLYDMTQRGSTALKDMSKRLLDTVERQNHERARILREIDAPKLDRLQKFLNGLNKELRQAAQAFIVDESMHGAYADAELNSPRNEHLYRRQTEEEKLAGTPRVFDNSLKNMQIELEHPAMMEELERLEREAPGFKEIRTMVHEWAREREIAMRTGRITDFLKVSGLNFSADKAVRAKEMEVLIRAVDADKIDGDRVLNRADLRAIRGVGDPNSGPLKVVLDKIANTADLDKKELQGPYTPFTRRGDHAVSGNFVLPMPDGAIVLPGGINRETGEQIGNPRYVFPTEEAARAYVKSITDKIGVKLIKAGQIVIDKATGEVPRGYDPDDPDSTARLRGKALTAELDRPGTTLEEQYYVQFQTKFLEFHPSERAAAKAIDEWMAHAKEKGFEMKLSQPKDVLDQEGRVNERYVGQQLMNLIRTAQASPAYQDLHPSEQGALKTQLKLAEAQYTMRRGLAQRYLPRGYVTGASTNLLETYNEWAGMTAGYLAKVKYAADLKERTNSMRDYVKATEGSKEAMLDSRLYNEFMERLHSPKVNPRDTWLNRQVERGLRWTMLDKLPSLAYFTVQMTEPAFVATPLLADHHGPVEIVGTMARMYKLAGASKFMREGLGDIKRAFKGEGGRFRWDHLFGELVKDEADGARLTSLYDTANERNYFDAAASLDFDRAYTSSRRWDDRAADWLQGMFQSANTAIENLNRFVTIGTAYRLEFSKLSKGGMEEAAAHEQAVQYALNKAHEANGIYSSYNAPPIFGSTTLGRVVSQFKKYPQRITANYIRAMVGTVGGFGDWAHGRKMTPEHKERARQLAYMIATQALVAGAMGLPTEVFAVPLNTMYIAGLSPYNWDDVQAGYRQWTANMFGVTGGEVATHGVLRLLGVDFASRLSQSSMWTFGSPASRKPNDLMASAATMFSGALGSSSMEFLKGVQKAAEGVKNYSVGATSLGNANMVEASKNLAMFRMFTDIIDAARKMSPEGMRTQSGAQMREPYGPFEAAAKAVGFTPKREAESSEARRAQQSATQQLKAKRKDWLDMWTQAQPSERTMMWPKIQKWNDSQPAGGKVTREELEKALVARRKRESVPASKLGLPTDKRGKSFEDIPRAYNL